MKDQIRIILIGDTGTGKSSVITSYISKYFPNEVPAVLVDAIIPIDSTANNVSVTIMDSSALLGDRDVLHQKIRMADSIISLFDVTRPETIDSLEELWLPTIRDICSPYPVGKAVIVVGNKTDLVSSDDVLKLEVEKMRMKKILKDFPFVVACYRCSAKLVDVDQIFYESELAVTFPIGPLFDTSRSEFTSACKVAFLRIFRCFDLNQDGLLSDEELNSLQQQSFGIPLKDEEVIALKQEISKSVRGGMMNESITFKGLMGIMRLFIYRCVPFLKGSFQLHYLLPFLPILYMHVCVLFLEKSYEQQFPFFFLPSSFKLHFPLSSLCMFIMCTLSLRHSIVFIDYLPPSTSSRFSPLPPHSLLVLLKCFRSFDDLTLSL